jgi:hypothetical protein
VSHADAALTPRHRLRLARLIVDEGWPVSHGASAFQVSWPTAHRWAQRYRQACYAGMGDRSSRPHRTTAPAGRCSRLFAASCICGGSSGWVRSRSPAGSGSPPRPPTRCCAAAGCTASRTLTELPASRCPATARADALEGDGSRYFPTSASTYAAPSGERCPIRSSAGTTMTTDEFSAIATASDEGLRERRPHVVDVGGIPNPYHHCRGAHGDTVDRTSCRRAYASAGTAISSRSLRARL